MLHLVTNVGFGGIASQARDLSGELVCRRRSRHLLLLKASEAEEKTRVWYEEAVPVEVISSCLEHSSGWRRIQQFRAFFAAQPEPIFHFHCFSQDFTEWRLLLAARSVGKQVIATLHHTVKWSQLSRIALVGQRIGWVAAHRFIVTTEAGKKLVCEGLPAEKVSVIPCGISRSSLRRPRDQARALLGIADDDFVIVCACRIARFKGVFDLASSVQRLSERNPNLRLLIAGEGPDFNELSACLTRNANIRLLGRVSNVNDVLMAGDLFALPSHEEGFGLVYAEAAACGVPSIASRIPTVSEVVIDGSTGWLVTPGCAAELDQAVTEAFSNRTECLRRGALAREFVTRFDIRSVVDQLETLYDEIT